MHSLAWRCVSECGWSGYFKRWSQELWAKSLLLNLTISSPSTHQLLIDFSTTLIFRTSRFDNSKPFWEKGSKFRWGPKLELLMVGLEFYFGFSRAVHIRVEWKANSSGVVDRYTQWVFSTHYLGKHVEEFFFKRIEVKDRNFRRLSNCNFEVIWICVE
jgi:hypothetical protein